MIYANIYCCDELYYTLRTNFSTRFLQTVSLHITYSIITQMQVQCGTQEVLSVLTSPSPYKQILRNDINKYMITQNFMLRSIIWDSSRFLSNYFLYLRPACGCTSLCLWFFTCNRYHCKIRCKKNPFLNSQYFIGFWKMSSIRIDIVTMLCRLNQLIMRNNNVGMTVIFTCTNFKTFSKGRVQLSMMIRTQTDELSQLGLLNNELTQASEGNFKNLYT